MRVAGSEGGRRGLCNAGSHVCSLPGCAAGRRSGLRRSRAASRSRARCGPCWAPRAPGRRGKGLGVGWGAGEGLLRPGLAVGPGRTRAGAEGRVGGSSPLRGTGSPLGRQGARAGAAGRARSGGGASPGGVGGATAAPPRAKFEKRTRFPPFFKPKNKTFSSISFAPLSPPDLPQSRPPKAGVARPGRPLWRRRLLPPPASRRRSSGAPAREAGPSVWAGGGSSRQPGRATSRHSAMLASTRLPPPREPTCWLGLPGPARLSRRWLWAAARRAEFAACLAPASPGLGSFWRELRAPAAADSSLGRTAVPSPLLKRATPGSRLRPSRASSGVLTGLGWALGPGGLCLRTCYRLSTEASTRLPRRVGLLRTVLLFPWSSSRTRAASCGPRRGAAPLPNPLFG